MIEKENRIPEKLFDAFLIYVANDKEWIEPKRIFSSKKELKEKLSFISYRKLFQLYNKFIEIKIEGERDLRIIGIIREIELNTLPNRKETHITLSKHFWNIVTELRKHLVDTATVNDIKKIVQVKQG